MDFPKCYAYKCQNPCGNWEKSTLEAMENKFDINAKCQLNLISFFIFLKLINVNG